MNSPFERSMFSETVGLLPDQVVRPLQEVRGGPTGDHADGRPFQALAYRSRIADGIDSMGEIGVSNYGLEGTVRTVTQYVRIQISMAVPPVKRFAGIPGSP
jgi:hypothetical protein